MFDVPWELVHYLSRLLAAECRNRGTRRRTRALTCWYQALMVLAWFHKRRGQDPAGCRVRPYLVPPPTATWQKASRSCPSRPLTCAPPCGRSPTKAGRTWWSTANCSPLTGWLRSPPASGVRPSTPGTPVSAAVGVIHHPDTVATILHLRAAALGVPGQLLQLAVDGAAGGVAGLVVGETHRTTGAGGGDLLQRVRLRITCCRIGVAATHRRGTGCA